MRIGEVIGTVTLAVQHPSLAGGRFHVVVPLSSANLQGDARRRAEPIVVYDELGAGQNALVGISESREAAQPYHPHEKPIDANITVILDSLDL